MAELTESPVIDALISRIIGPDGALPVGAEPWTPNLGGSTSNPVVTYSAQEGWMARVGPLVIARWTVTTTAHSGGSGNAQILGLPITPRSSGGPNIAAIGTAEFSQLVLPGGRTQLTARVSNSGTILLISQGSAMGVQTLGLTNWPNDATVRVSGSVAYITP